MLCVKMLMNLLKKSLVPVLLACCTLCVAAANVVISGRVIDHEEKPIEFATVRIEGKAIGTNTDLKGYYSLNVPQADTIKVIFSCIGYRTVTQKLIDPQDSVKINVKLPLNETELEQCRSDVGNDGRSKFEQRNVVAIQCAWRIV